MVQSSASLIVCSFAHFFLFLISLWLNLFCFFFHFSFSAWVYIIQHNFNLKASRTQHEIKTAHNNNNTDKLCQTSLKAVVFAFTVSPRIWYWKQNLNLALYQTHTEGGEAKKKKFSACVSFSQMTITTSECTWIYFRSNKFECL